MGSVATTAVRKRIHIPVEGSFLTDGVRLVEVMRRCPEGWRVLDALKPLAKSRTELLRTADLGRWQIVKPEED